VNDSSPDVIGGLEEFSRPLEAQCTVPIYPAILLNESSWEQSRLNEDIPGSHPLRVGEIDLHDADPLVDLQHILSLLWSFGERPLSLQHDPVKFLWRSG
jgi:hypothetical protein